MSVITISDDSTLEVMDDSNSSNIEAAAIPEVSLSEEQVEALEAVVEGKNVFITGSAGVGKSFLLNQIIKVLSKKKIYVTASTGVAACNIGGITLHSFSGIGLGTKSVEELTYQILAKNYKVEVKKRWQSCQVLVIDEISMIDGEIFTKIENIARKVRKCEKPFGGIQIVLCGDFLQLPPVNVKTFAFETGAWSSTIHKTIVLKKVFRQKLIGFVTLLNRLRIGRLTGIDVEVLHECGKTRFSNDGIMATRLFPFRNACDQLNLRELSKLNVQPKMFKAEDWAQSQTYQEQMEKNCKYPKVLELKVGAQVMLLTNLSVSTGLVNGARGVVIAFKNRKQEIAEEVDRYAKAQSLNASEIQGYLDMLNSMEEQEAHDDDGYPVIKFANGIEQCIKNDQITIEINKKPVAHRTQLPLNLAWAVSVHKAQGMTLERIDINIAKVFEHGQAYVALSRVTCLDGLLLRDFDPSRITAHPKVLKYYKKIDPSFDHWSKSGEDELKEFIDRRRNPHKYKHEIEAKEKEERERKLALENEKIKKLEEMLVEANAKHESMEVLREHDYAVSPVTTPSSYTPSNSKQTSNCIDLTYSPLANNGRTPYMNTFHISSSTPIPQTTHHNMITPITNNLTANITPLKQFTHGTNSLTQNIVLENNKVPNPSPTCTSNALLRAEQQLAKCKSVLADIKNVIPNPENNTEKDNKILNTVENINTIQHIKQILPVESNTGIKPTNEMIGSDLNKALEEEHLDCSNKNLITDQSGNVTCVVESDPEDLFDAPNGSINVSKNTAINDAPNGSINFTKNTTNHEVNDKQLISLETPRRRSTRNRKRKSYEDFFVDDFSNDSKKNSTPRTKNTLELCNTGETELGFMSASKVMTSESTTNKTYIANSSCELTNNKSIQKQIVPIVCPISTIEPIKDTVNDEKMKALLEAKRDEIEEKRRQALMRRLSSLKRTPYR